MRANECLTLPVHQMKSAYPKSQSICSCKRSCRRKSCFLQYWCPHPTSTSLHLTMAWPCSSIERGQMTSPVTGGCLCGSVKYSLHLTQPLSKLEANYCHCTQCRKATGAQLGTFVHGSQAPAAAHRQHPQEVPELGKCPARFLLGIFPTSVPLPPSPLLPGGSELCPLHAQ